MNWAACTRLAATSSGDMLSAKLSQMSLKGSSLFMVLVGATGALVTNARSSKIPIAAKSLTAARRGDRLEPMQKSSLSQPSVSHADCSSASSCDNLSSICFYSEISMRVGWSLCLCFQGLLCCHHGCHRFSILSRKLYVRELLRGLLHERCHKGIR
ncbi:unnamed protein product [Symbiodinium sp. CCMP2456]|nr:unnamed protein product [Symbiodinium sp. CCMP2456]